MATQPKFSVGQRVRVVSTADDGLAGQTGVVTEHKGYFVGTIVVRLDEFGVTL